MSGRLSHISLGGYEYCITFIDDYSKFTCIFFLKTKDEVFQYFNEFKALVENQTSRKIKVSRSNNGGEYTKGEFANFCASEGIRYEFTVPYTPQQNGVVERENKAIVRTTRAMLHDQGLPLFLWAKACNTTMYLQNKSPHQSLGNQTPQEAFSRQKPQLGQLCIFGCLTYSQVPKEKRTKLDPTAEKGIFVGYNDTSKAFRIYIPALRRVVLRQDVKFKGGESIQEVMGVGQVTAISCSVTEFIIGYRFTGHRWTGYRGYISVSVSDRSINEWFIGSYE